mgnify:CR=1 FL=1
MSKQFFPPERYAHMPVNLFRHYSNIVSSVTKGQGTAKWNWMVANVACRELNDDMMFIAPVPYCELANEIYSGS